MSRENGVRSVIDGIAGDLRGKSVFVAGGTSGINLGIARAFASCGAFVGVLSRSPDKVNAAVAEISSFGEMAFGAAADVRDASAVEEVIGQFARSVSGTIDIVVSGAAGNFLCSAKDLSPNGFKTVIDIDLLGSFNVAKAAYPHLERPGGVLLNISAPQAYAPTPNQIHACAAKAGIDQLSRTLALEWGSEGIRVNSIVPGAIAGTEGMARLTNVPLKEHGRASDRVLATIPLGRYGQVDDVAALALFLSSEAASYISGAVVPVDGGWGPSGPVPRSAAAAG